MTPLQKGFGVLLELTAENRATSMRFFCKEFSADGKKYRGMIYSNVYHEKFPALDAKNAYLFGDSHELYGRFKDGKLDQSDGSLRKLNVMPQEYVGEVKFGMSRNEVRKIWGEAEEFKKDPDDEITTDDFGFLPRVL